MKVIYPGIIKRIKRMLTGNYVEDGNTASQNIAAGKYVTWKNQLCKATTAITTGDTLSSSNLEAVTDGGINALNSNIGTFDTSKVFDGTNYSGSLTISTKHTPKTGRILVFSVFKTNVPSGQMMFITYSIDGTTWTSNIYGQNGTGGSGYDNMVGMYSFNVTKDSEITVYAKCSGGGTVMNYNYHTIFVVDI